LGGPHRGKKSTTFVARKKCCSGGGAVRIINVEIESDSLSIHI